MQKKSERNGEQTSPINNPTAKSRLAAEQESPADLRLAAAMDCLDAGVTICEAAWPDCPVIYVSKGFTVFTQYTPEEALGQKLSFLLGPEARALSAEQLRLSLADKRRLREEFQWTRKDGKSVWCELILSSISNPEGEQSHLVAVLTDVTTRKLREEHLRDAQSRYGGVFENAVEGIYQSTPDGHYLAVNPALARMYGYKDPEELLNGISDISQQIYVDATYRERFRTAIEQSGQVRGMEYQVRHRDGSIFWISECARVVRDGDGRTLYYEGFIEDVTSRKEAELHRARLEKEMVQAQKMDAIGTMAGGIAHDFNNILCAMLGLTELALASDQITGLPRKNLEAVLKSAGRAKDLVRQILTFSRRGESDTRPVRLSAIIKECVKLLNATLPSSIEIVCKIETTEDIVFADATELHQVIMNLGTNAAHAMRRTGGKLEYNLKAVELSEGEASHRTPLHSGPHVYLSVSDTGHGMSREVLENIFDPFFTTKPVGEGTGLGLTLVQRIIARCGGSIEVESRENAGTRFQIHIPRAAQATIAIENGRGHVLHGHRERLLIVDDEVLILDMMQQHLRKMNYRVTTRADSKTALETFKEEPDKYDLVITDHQMPCMQGAELAERMGQIRADVPVILMSGLNQPPGFAGSHFAARRAVIRKPIDFVDLSKRLRQILDTKEMQRARIGILN